MVNSLPVGYMRSLLSFLFKMSRDINPGCSTPAACSTDRYITPSLHIIQINKHTHISRTNDRLKCASRFKPFALLALCSSTRINGYVIRRCEACRIGFTDNPKLLTLIFRYLKTLRIFHPDKTNHLFHISRHASNAGSLIACSTQGNRVHPNKMADVVHTRLKYNLLK